MRNYSERIITVGLANEAGPAVVPVELVINQATLELEAWISNFGGSNVYIFEGDMSLAQCQNEIKGGGTIDCVMPLTGIGPTRVPLGSNIRRLTVFFEAENKAKQIQSVCLKIIECFR